MRLLLRVIGSPDPYGKHIDGMGGATSSTSKTVILSKSSAARPRRGLPVRPGVHRQGLRRLERQLRQPVDGRRPFAIQRAWSIRRGSRRKAPAPCASGRPTSARPSSRTCRSARRSAGNRRLRARRRDLPRRGGACSSSWTRGRRDGDGRRDVSHRQPRGRPRGARRRHAAGHDDQRRHPDRVRERRGRSATPAPSCSEPSTPTRRRSRCSRPSVPTARCAWASSRPSDQAQKRQHTPKVAFVARPADYVCLQRQADRWPRHRPARARPVHGQAAPRDDGHGRRCHRHRGSDPRHAGQPGRRRRRARRYASATRPAPCGSARKRAGQR
jgi:hypothetical protein